MDFFADQSSNMNNNLLRSSQMDKALSRFENMAKSKSVSEQKKIEEAAQGFESMFVNMLISQMRKTIPDSELLENGPGRQMFEEMFDQEISKKISERGGIGIADAVKREFERHYNDMKHANTGIDDENIARQDS